MQKDRSWERYKNHSRATSVPRLAFAHIKSKERYYLRCLLLEKKGCYNFQDIRTHDHREYTSFHETADVMRLLNDDEELFKCMREAVYNDTSKHRIMDLFVLILTSYHPDRSLEM